MLINTQYNKYLIEELKNEQTIRVFVQHQYDTDSNETIFSLNQEQDKSKVRILSKPTLK